MGANHENDILKNVMAGIVSPGNVAPSIENDGIRVIDGIPTVHTIDDANNIDAV